jgi:hypothetical protein
MAKISYNGRVAKVPKPSGEPILPIHKADIKTEELEKLVPELIKYNRSLIEKMAATKIQAKTGLKAESQNSEEPPLVNWDIFI